MLDWVLRGARVIDGTGAPARFADLGVKYGRIVAIGTVVAAARQERNIEGLVVAPGFIDVHTHDDRLVLSQPAMEPKVSQGITTVLVGHCGISLVPPPLGPLPVPPLTLLSEQRADFLADIRVYRAALAAAPSAVNVLALVGHTTLRAHLFEDLDRPARASEIAAMQDLLRRFLQEGASGLSTGLAYPPARGAPAAEVEALLSVVAEAGGLQTAHLRDEGDSLMAALEEALVSARKTSTPLVVSHLKCAGPKVWGRAAKVLARFDEAQGVQKVAFDLYPYDASSTMLRGDRLKGSRKVVVSWSQPHPEQAGREVAEIARCWCCSPEEAADRMAPGGAIYYKMQERDVQRILAHPLGMIGSDGLPHDQHPHPRLWGTFPRILGHYVRELKLLTLEEAVRRMTALPAEVFGLADRGRLQEGAVADLAVFDPATILDEATFDHPARAARGIETVFVRGIPVWEAGRSTGQRPGQWLRRAGMAAPA